MKPFVIILLTLMTSISHSQINEVLIESTGMTLPRMNTSQRNALTPIQGQCIYNTQSKSLECFDGINWSTSNSSSGTVSSIADNDGDTSIDLEKTPDDDVISFTSKGVEVMTHDGQTLHMTNNGQSVFVGENAGAVDDLTNNRNTFVGSLAGQTNTTGTQNVAVGHQALKDNVVGSNNIAIGQQALQKNNNSNNVAIGFNAARDNSNGNKNVAVGGFSGFINQTGIENTFIGYEAGRNTSTSTSGSVMIGHQAGMNETNNNRLYIANDNTATPLIYGEFDNQKVVTNGDHEIMGEAKISTMDPATPTAQPVAREADGTLSVISTNATPTYAVGDFAQGGVVFWVSSSGKHGKVASIFNFNEARWSNIGTDFVGEIARNRKNGAGNTVGIMMQPGHTESAARMCADFAYAGYDDWYLPTRDEMHLIRVNQSTINSVSNAHGGQSIRTDVNYWSSEETDNNPGQAWTIDMNATGNSSFSGTKTIRFYITRAIRSF